MRHLSQVIRQTLQKLENHKVFNQSRILNFEPLQEMVTHFKGVVGEAWVKGILSLLDDEQYIVLHNLLLPSREGKTAQIDHVVVSLHGIFVIETKNYKGWIFGNESNRNWTQALYNQKHSFYNPIWQNYGHIKALQALLDRQDIPFYSIVVFDSKAELKEIKVDSPQVAVIYDFQLIDEIKRVQNIIWNSSQAKTFADCLKAKNINNRANRKEHVQAIKQSLQEKERAKEQGLCPKCGKKLVERKGKYGTFFGCSGYPSCRHTEQKTP